MELTKNPVYCSVDNSYQVITLIKKDMYEQQIKK